MSPRADLGGGCRGCAPPPEMTFGFLIQLVFCKKKMWVIGVEVEQETSTPPPEKKSWIRPWSLLTLMAFWVVNYGKYDVTVQFNIFHCITFQSLLYWCSCDTPSVYTVQVKSYFSCLYNKGGIASKQMRLLVVSWCCRPVWSPNDITQKIDKTLNNSLTTTQN